MIKKPSVMSVLFILCSAVGMFASGGAARADELRRPDSKGDVTVPVPAYDTSKFLLGGWGGWRERLHDEGVDVQLGYVSEFAYNPKGGNSHRGAYSDQAFFGLTADFEKLIGLHGGSFHMLVTDRNGSELNDKAKLGTLLEVQEVHGRGSIPRFALFYYEQKFLDDALDVRLGRLPISIDIASFSCEFENLSFCGSLPGYVDPNWYTDPVSQWGIRTTYSFDNNWYVRYSGTQVNPSYLNNDQGSKLDNPSGTIGFLSIGEIGWKPRLGAAGLRGDYHIGVWYDSADTNDVFLDVNRQPKILTGATALKRGSESGVYVFAQQQVTGSGDTNRGLSIFLNVVQGDQNVSSTDQLVSIGAFYTGPLSFRPQDLVGFAIGRSHVNRRVADAQELFNASLAPGSGISPIPVQGSEYPSELFYSINVTPALTFRPNIQYIHRPGGTTANEDALVLGMRFLVTF